MTHFPKEAEKSSCLNFFKNETILDLQNYMDIIKIKLSVNGKNVLRVVGVIISNKELKIFILSNYHWIFIFNYDLIFYKEDFVSGL